MVPFGTRLDLRLAMLQYPLRYGPTEELVWYVAEVNALRRVRSEVSSAVRARLIAETRRWVLRDLRTGRDPGQNGQAVAKRPSERPVPASLTELLDRFGESTIESWSDELWEGFTLQALWRLCCDGVREVPPFTLPPHVPVRHRDLLFEATGGDADFLVNELLIRFSAAFLDQGLASWQLPRRDDGFLRAFCALYGQSGGPPDRWLRGLSAELSRLEREGVTPQESIRESLEILGVREGELDEFLTATLLSLRGWARMVHPDRTCGDRVVQPAPAGSLSEFLAVRLILDRFALAYTAREAFDYEGPLAELRDALRARNVTPWPPSVEQRAFPIFQLAQVFGVSPDVLYRLSPQDWANLDLRGRERSARSSARRLFHMAYERAGSTSRRSNAIAAPRGASRRRRRPSPGSRRSLASTSARSRSAVTSRNSPPTRRRTARRDSTRSRCTTGARATPTPSRSARP